MTIETKFHWNDKVFFLWANKIHDSNIVNIQVKTNHNAGIEILYQMSGTIYTEWFKENKLFKTKEDLLASL